MYCRLTQWITALVRTCCQPLSLACWIIECMALNNCSVRMTDQSMSIPMSYDMSFDLVCLQKAFLLPSDCPVIIRCAVTRSTLQSGCLESLQKR